LSIRVFDRPADLGPAIGEDLGVSSWHVITQRDVNRFARLTGDGYWLHTDVERARSSRYGGTIVHGFLVLALSSKLLEEIYLVRRRGTSVNYGLDSVRFIAALPVGEEVRLRARLLAVDKVDVGTRVQVRLDFERRAEPSLVCVAKWLGMYLS
jgi:acyl dehydratase